MKKLNSINYVAFKQGKLYLEDIPISLGINIEVWLKESCNISYEFENYSSVYPESERIKFKNYEKGVSIYLENRIIESVNIYPYEYQSSSCFKGDIFIFDKNLEVPFKSDNIENYFPAIEIKPKGYFKRFSPRETVDYPISDKFKIEISMGRDPELVSSISLKHK